MLIEFFFMSSLSSARRSDTRIVEGAERKRGAEILPLLFLVFWGVVGLLQQDKNK